MDAVPVNGSQLSEGVLHVLVKKAESSLLPEAQQVDPAAAAGVRNLLEAPHCSPPHRSLRILSPSGRTDTQRTAGCGRRPRTHGWGQHAAALWLDPAALRVPLTHISVSCLSLPLCPSQDPWVTVTSGQSSREKQHISWRDRSGHRLTLIVRTITESTHSSPGCRLHFLNVHSSAEDVKRIRDTRTLRFGGHLCHTTKNKP